MSSIKIATWNVNSLRVRLPHVQAWLADVKPDVLAIQEIKCIDEDFPATIFQEMGYHAVCSGQKAYNGVCILSRLPAENIVKDIPELEDPQRRVLGVTINDVRILNLYVPNGESVNSEKYLYKLNWLKHLHSYLQHELKTHSKLIVLGDFNIAPAEIDVHDPHEWEGSVLFSKPERDALQAILKTGLMDCFRVLHPEEKQYSWWDYRLNSFKRDRGLRIDHILANDAFAHECIQCHIDKAPRALERPSDHAPVVAEFRVS